MSTARRVRAWIARHIVADDPHPEYSRLDHADGLTKEDADA